MNPFVEFAVVAALALVWGLVMAALFNPPISIIFSMVGGGIIGWNANRIIPW